MINLKGLIQDDFLKHFWTFFKYHINPKLQGEEQIENLETEKAQKYLVPFFTFKKQIRQPRWCE